MPFTALIIGFREVLIILLKLDKSGSASKSKKKGQDWKKRTAKGLPLTTRLTMHAFQRSPQGSTNWISRDSYNSILKLDTSGRASKSKKYVKTGRKGLPKDCLWPHGPSATHDRFMGLWRIYAPSRLSLRLAQSHLHPEAQRPRSDMDHLEEQRRVRHCSSELHMKLACLLYSRKDCEIKNWCALLSAFNPIVPNGHKTMTPSKSWQILINSGTNGLRTFHFRNAFDQH